MISHWKQTPVMQNNEAAMEKSVTTPKKLKIELSNDPVILPLGIYTEELKTRPWRDIYTPIFSTALFTIAKK